MAGDRWSRLSPQRSSKPEDPPEDDRHRQHPDGRPLREVGIALRRQHEIHHLRKTHRHAGPSDQVAEDSDPVAPTARLAGAIKTSAVQAPFR